MAEGRGLGGTTPNLSAVVGVVVVEEDSSLGTLVEAKDIVGPPAFGIARRNFGFAFHRRSRAAVEEERSFCFFLDPGSTT